MFKMSFKNGEAFLEHQCKFGRTDIQPNHGIVALVLDARKEFGTQSAVKIDDDGRQIAVLRVASEDGGFVVPAKTMTNKGDKLKPDDVVVWVPFEYAESIAENAGDDMDLRFAWVGSIVAKIAAEIDTSSPDLTILCRYD